MQVSVNRVGCYGDNLMRASGCSAPSVVDVNLNVNVPVPIGVCRLGVFHDIYVSMLSGTVYVPRLVVNEMQRT